jgi:ligand-binding sensor domain-containing protein
MRDSGGQLIAARAAAEFRRRPRRWVLPLACPDRGSVSSAALKSAPRVQMRATARHHRYLQALLCPVLWVLSSSTGAGVAAATVQPARAPYVFERVGDIEQVPDGVITALTQDGQGLLWIGTTDGLVRFDGYRFRRYAHDRADSGSLPGNRIQALLAARDGRLWVGTHSNGVAVYDAVSDRFERFDTAQGAQQPLPAGGVRALAETPDGAIWVGTTGSGLVRIDRTGTVQEFRADGDETGLLDDRISALAVDAGGSLWIGSWQGLSRRRPASGVFERVLSDPGDPDGFANTTIRGIHVASDGAVWVGAQQGQMARLPVELLGRVQPPQASEVQRWRGNGMNAAI